MKKERLYTLRQCLRKRTASISWCNSIRDRHWLSRHQGYLRVSRLSDLSLPSKTQEQFSHFVQKWLVHLFISLYFNEKKKFRVRNLLPSVYWISIKIFSYEFHFAVSCTHFQFLFKKKTAFLMYLFCMLVKLSTFLQYKCMKY